MHWVVAESEGAESWVVVFGRQVRSSVGVCSRWGGKGGVCISARAFQAVAPKVISQPHKPTSVASLFPLNSRLGARHVRPAILFRRCSGILSPFQITIHPFTTTYKADELKSWPTFQAAAQSQIEHRRTCSLPCDRSNDQLLLPKKGSKMPPSDAHG